MKKKLITLAIVLASQSAFSLTKENRKKIFTHFGEGYYLDTLDEINKQLKTNSRDPELYYYQGISYKKLQEYEKARKAFASAKRYGINKNDFHYEYGQTLYALKKYDQALNQFKLSIKKKYNRDSSKLYGAIILEDIGNPSRAFLHYVSLAKSKDKSIAQSAMYRQGLYMHKTAKKKRNKKDIILNKVLKKYNQAIETAPESGLVSAIQGEIRKINTQYGMVDKKLPNGHYFKYKRYDISVKLETAYNSNITQEADDATIQATNKDSLLQNTNVDGQYRFLINDYLIVTPKLSLSHTIHFERNTPAVYENDVYYITPGIDTKLEHHFLGKPASGLFNYAYSYNGKDYNQKKDIQKYAVSHKFTIGEQVDYFKIGSTTAKFEFEDYNGYASTLNYTGYAFTGTQIIILKKNHLLIAYGELRSKRYPSNVTSDTNGGLFRGDYLYSKFYKKFDLSANLSLGLTDYINDDSRGVEKKIAPGVSISRKFLKRYKAKLSYDFTKNLSKNKTSYEYTTSEIAFSIKAGF